MRLTGLSGNEIYCLKLVGMDPGNLAIGNSVFSIGLMGSFRAGFSGMVGGEIHDFTSMISEGRALSLARLKTEIQQHGGQGATGVSSELVFHPGNVEFLSVGSTVHVSQAGVNFTSSSDGQELYCQMDAGYMPLQFVFGNVAYSIGLGNALIGGLKTLARGEIEEYTLREGFDRLPASYTLRARMPRRGGRIRSWRRSRWPIPGPPRFRP